MKQSITLEVLGANVTKVWLGSKTILFSYNTPVAVWLLGDEGQKGFIVKERQSHTTTRHIRQYGPYTFEVVPADELARLIAEQPNRRGRVRPLPSHEGERR